jgi:hypothetical protein
MEVMRRRVAQGYQPLHPLDARMPEALSLLIERARKAPNGRFKAYNLIQRWEDERGITDTSGY